MISASSVIVWDQVADPTRDAGTQILCWRSYLHGDAITSVPRYLEEHSECIRDRYLAFVHDLGEYRIAGKRIIDHLELGDGFSLWWLTLIAEKNPLKSQRIYDCLRLIALDEILTDQRPGELILVSSNRALSQAIGGLCDSRSIAFRWQRCRTATAANALRRLYSSLAAPIQGLLSLRHIALRWRLRRLRSAGWLPGSDGVFFCSYFIHLDPAEGASGRFHSRHWEGLPHYLHERGMRTNWLQLFLLSAVIPDVGTGLRWAQAFNRDSAIQGRHLFLESFLSWRILRDALGYWWGLSRARRRLSSIASAFKLRASDLNLWPILRDDWLSSVTGPAAMSNCLHVALFDAVFAALPRQRIGLYLYENQPWELALLRAWRRHGHGRIIGVQHSTTPFWYLPHSTDSRPQPRSIGPMPDYLAINGPAARSAFLAAGFPPDKLAEVEALRYLDLGGLADRRRARAESNPGVAGASGCGRRVLVLGEIAPQPMQHLLGMLDAVWQELTSRFRFTFKPHPSHAVNLADYPRLRMRETDQALGGLLDDYDIAITGNGTSAAVDAHIAGLPVVIGVHGASLNLSPLRGQPGVYFVTTGRELVDALLAAASRGAVSIGRDEFFFLDPGLRRWKRLLEYGSEC